MVKYITATCMLLAIMLFPGAEARSSSSAPPPAVDCSSIMYDMSDCMDFVQEGSNETTPIAECCPGFQTVADAGCVCYAMKYAVETLGYVIDMKRAARLAPVCHIHNAPPVPSCNISISPAASPGPSSALSPSPSAWTPGPGPSSGGGSIDASPSPAPHKKSGASSNFFISSPLLILIATMPLLLSFFSFLAY